MEIRRPMILPINFETTVKIQHVEATIYSVQVNIYRLARNVFARILSSDEVFLYHAYIFCNFLKILLCKCTYILRTEKKCLNSQSSMYTLNITKFFTKFCLTSIGLKFQRYNHGDRVSLLIIALSTRSIYMYLLLVFIVYILLYRICFYIYMKALGRWTSSMEFLPI